MFIFVVGIKNDMKVKEKLLEKNPKKYQRQSYAFRVENLGLPSSSSMILLLGFTGRSKNTPHLGYQKNISMTSILGGRRTVTL
jgi:hypothetical protein